MRWQELTRTTYYNTNKTESIDIVIPKVTNKDREVNTLGIWCSGGTDSSLLLYLLCKEVQDKNLNIKVQPMSVRRQRPWNPVKASQVINKVIELQKLVLENFNLEFEQVILEDLINRLKRIY